MLRAEILGQRGDVEGVRKIHEQLRARQLKYESQNDGTTIGPLLQRASEAAHAGRFEEAATLGQEAVAASSHASDAWILAAQYTALANELAQKGNTEIADNLYRRGHAELLRQADVDVNVLLMSLHSYVHYLFEHKRWDEAKTIIEARREQLLAAKGPDAAQLEEIFLAEIGLAGLQDRRAEELPLALRLLAHQERVHGEFSDPALRAMETIAELHASREEFAEALCFRRRALGLGEKLWSPSDFRRAMLLSSLASDEVRSGLRDDAIAHLEQAIAVAAAGSSPREAEQFREQLGQLRRPEP